MNTLYQQRFLKGASKSKSHEALQNNYHQDLATQAMMLSFGNSFEDEIGDNEDENHSYVLGYN